MVCIVELMVGRYGHLMELRGDRKASLSSFRSTNVIKMLLSQHVVKTVFRLASICKSYENAQMIVIIRCFHRLVIMT